MVINSNARNLFLRRLGLAAAAYAFVWLPCSPCRAQQAAGEAAAAVVITFTKPVAFAYGTWEGKAKVEKGVFTIAGEGATPKGGAGIVETLDLSSHAGDTPAFKLNAGTANTEGIVRLMLVDQAGHAGTWAFTVPKSDKETLVWANDGASFAHPPEVGKGGLPDLAHIVHYQIIGDWGGDGKIDLRITSVLALKPNDAILAARKAKLDADEAAREQAVKDRIAAREKYGKRTADSPSVTAVYAASADILGLEIRSGKITPGSYHDYKPLPGDEQKTEDKELKLYRKGVFVGRLIGPKHDAYITQEGFSGDPLLTVEADDPANYRIDSTDDANFSTPVQPAKVMRKSKADGWQQPTQPGVTVCHNVYLALPHPLIPGKSYRIAFANINTLQPSVTLRLDPAKTWTESVHVPQVGFRPDDPGKRAFVSLWMGTSGGCEFPVHPQFHVVDAVTGVPVYSGHGGDTWPASKDEVLATKRNFNGADVIPLDFSDLRKPGKYRVELDGVGVSYPFQISRHAWADAFRVQLKGYYAQRSGIDVGPPYSAYWHKADFHPGMNDCPPITQSAYANIDGTNQLAQMDTGKPMPQAWGGYHDAGDWNPRRITHMTTTTFLQLELLDLFPETFANLKLNIPNDAPGPDLLKECLFELSLFHRLQDPDGGVSYGIETDGDPGASEVSWKQTMHAYVYAPDIEASYIYAVVAARAARVLARYDKAMAKTYRESALRAMDWAEADRAKRMSSGMWTKVEWLAKRRAVAAAALLALTREAKWDRIAREDSDLNEAKTREYRGDQAARDAAFLYATLPTGVGDPTVKEHAKAALLHDADGALAVQGNNAFGIASDDFGRPQFLGYFSMAHGGISLVRAHYLTHAPKYLAGAVKTCAFSTGANPGNLCFTTGLGANPVKHPLNVDAIVTGQTPPPGLVPYGIIDLTQWHAEWITWPITYFLGKWCEPGIFEWPTTESFLDVTLAPGFDEFTMDQTMGQNSYVWGYLAARK